MSRSIAVFIPLLGIPGEQIGGAKCTAIKLAKGLALNGYPTDLVVFNSQNLLQDEISQSVHLVSLKTRGWSDAFFKLKDYIQRNNPSVILAQDNRAAMLAVFVRGLTKAPTKIIITIHTTLSQRWSDLSTPRRLLMPKIVRPFLLRTDAVVAVSNAAAEDLVSLLHLPKNLVRIIYNPIISEDIFIKAKEEPVLPWFTDNEPPVVLGVGRLSREKDFETLLKAFALVRAKRCARLVILGEGKMRHALEGLAKELSIDQDVMMPGAVENPFPYMLRAAVFVLSSLYEGLPSVLVEALALGTPVVSTDCSGGSAEILENGKWGKLVPPKDPQAMAEAVLQMLEAPRKLIPHEVWRRFTVEASVKQYLALISDLDNSCPC
jgi:glycosyltransferase involved in cell wall biosynthesis